MILILKWQCVENCTHKRFRLAEFSDCLHTPAPSSRVAAEVFQRCGFEVLSHPPDLNPNDCFLFLKLKKKKKRKKKGKGKKIRGRFNTTNEVKQCNNAVQCSLHSTSIKACQEKCITLDIDYEEKPQKKIASI